MPLPWKKNASGAGASAAPGKKPNPLTRPFRFIVRHRGAFGKGVAIVLIVAVSWLPALVINNVMGYAPGIFVTLGILLSGLYLLALRKGLDCQEATRVNECIRGEDVDFVVRLANKTPLLYPRIEVVFFRSDLFGADANTNTSEIILAPRAKRDFVFSMRFDHLGRYKAGLKRVVLHDLLGLFKFTFEYEDPQTISVMPRLYEMDKVEFSSEAPTQSTKSVKSVLNEGMDYAMVREYHWGDPIKSIHWKISARTDVYMVRIYETNTNPGLTTVVDLHAPATNAETLMQLYDAVLESALSLDEFARAAGLECTLEFKDDTGATCRNSGRMLAQGLNKLTGLLCEDSSCYEGDALEILRNELNSQYAQNNIALCTSALDEALVEVLLQTKARRRNPMVFFAVPQGLDGRQRRDYLEPLRRLDEASIPYVAFSAAAELSPAKEGGTQ